MATLSICMIVRDEEKFLELCLNQVKDLADEIIIVDNGSIDKTKEIAAKFTDTVLDFKKIGDFSATRNFSLKQATSNWILVLDADEFISDTDKEKIRLLINNRDNCLKDVVGFKFEQRTYHPKTPDATIAFDKESLDKDYSGFETAKVVRLFKNTEKIRYKNKVHELVEDSIRDNHGEMLETDIVLHHFSFLKKNRLPKKIGEYAELVWSQLEGEPENPRYNFQAAMAFFDSGNKELALKYLLRTAKFDEDYPGVFREIAKVYLEMGKLSHVIRFLNLAIAKNKSDTSALNNLAVIYMHAEKLDVAEKLLKKGLEIEPKSACMKNNLEKIGKLRNSKK